MRGSESRTAGPISVATDLGSGLEETDSCRVIVRGPSVANRSQRESCDRIATGVRSLPATLERADALAQRRRRGLDPRVDQHREPLRHDVDLLGAVVFVHAL